jgi:hypothetical protein
MIFMGARYFLPPSPERPWTIAPPKRRPPGDA